MLNLMEDDMIKRKWKKIAVIALAMVMLLSLAACGQTTNTNEDTQTDTALTVAVTIVPEETFVKAVGGDLVKVVTLVPPGSSPESYEPTPQVMADFHDASAYFSIGVPTEEANILPNVGDVKVVSLNDAVASTYDERLFESGERDPHIWLSPKRVKVMIETIEQELSSLDPSHAETFKANAEAYQAKLDQLDTDITEALKDVSNKKFIVFHPAFGYLAEDYGLEMFALEEEGKEATPEHLKELIDVAKDENIKVIFYQSEIDSSQSQSFAEELGGKTIQLAPLAPNYIENLEKMAKTMAEAME